MSIATTLNGKPFTIVAEPDTPLLWVLRDEALLTGTKFGCGCAPQYPKTSPSFIVPPAHSEGPHPTFPLSWRPLGPWLSRSHGGRSGLGFPALMEAARRAIRWCPAFLLK